MLSLSYSSLKPVDKLYLLKTEADRRLPGFQSTLTGGLQPHVTAPCVASPSGSPAVPSLPRGLGSVYSTGGSSSHSLVVSV